MRYVNRVFVLFTAAYFLSYFYRSTNAVIAPDLISELGLSAGQLGLMTSLFFATFALLQLPLGVWLDRWGARWVTPGLMLITAAGSLLFATAAGFGGLAAGRALIGVGMAGVLMGALQIFSQWYPLNRFATMSGLLVGIGSMGALAAATPLAWLNQTIGWRAVFLLGAGFTVLVAVAIMGLVRNTPPGREWQGQHTDRGGLRVVLLDRRIWHLMPLAFFFGGTLLAFQGLWAGPYLFDVLRVSELQAGNMLLGMGTGATAGYIASGWLSDRFGLTGVLITAITIFILCQVGLALQPALAYVFAFYVLFGFCGAFNIMILAHARLLFTAGQVGRAVTAVNLFGIGGTFILQWLLGLLISLYARDAAGHYPPAAYRTILLFCASGCLLALLWYLPLVRQTRSRTLVGTKRSEGTS